MAVEIDLHSQLHDPVLEEEIELLADLMVVAAAAEGPLRLPEIDRALHVESPRDGAHETGAG